MSDLQIRVATADDVPLIFRFISDLARYERLEHEVRATEDSLRESLFGVRRYAEVLIGEAGGAPAGFALFFHNFSTFVGRQGIYLEDLFIEPHLRGQGYGKALLTHLAALAVERKCGRLEWAVLDWNEPAIGFYRSLGAVPMEDWRIFRLTGPALDRVASSAR